MQGLTCPGCGQGLEGTSVHVSGEGPRILLSPLPWGHGDRHALCLSRGCAAPCNYTFFKLGRIGLLEKPH